LSIFPSATISNGRLNVSFWPKADVSAAITNVCFWGAGDVITKTQLKEVTAAAQAMGLQIQVYNADTSRD
jgi:hypothetical protein